ncbi:MAG: metallophosphatase family protein [Bacteroidales bacterium]|jgi:putative phosphoesterase|nr:metallophosphatase family protein [Bacteroidales bacterium]
MIKIGLISDTHGVLLDEVLNFLTDTDEIWHAGDIGSEEVLDKLEKFKPIRAVYGNADNHQIRLRTKENLRFMIENVDVWITHIGGYPSKYEKHIIKEIYNNPPKLFISGHSHILKVTNDKKLKLLHINPGASGNIGWHTFITAVKFTIDDDRIKDLFIFEKKRTFR